MGQKTSYTDRTGTTHQYGYDVLGRLVSDIIPWWAVGTGVSTQTTGINYSFNDAGLPFKQTSLTNWDQSAVENQVQDQYNGYGQLIKQYQESGGSVNTSTSDDVQYGYSQPTGANYSRLSSMTYPNGRVEDYGYNTGIDATISRVSYIADDAGSSAGHVAEYTYLGLSAIVVENEPEAGVELTCIQVPGDTSYNSDGGDRYTGLDRFGRVIDQAYYVTASPPSTPAFTDRLQYGYDRDNNVLYAKNLVNSSFSELYHANSAATGDNNTAYDPLSRITSFRRGTLTSSGNNSSSLDTITSGNLNSTTSVPNTNSWNLDALGNWASGNGSSNTFNSQNQETANGSHTLAYDNAGSMTTDEQGNTYVWDAWGHVVQVKNSGGSTLETFKYDALGRNDQVNNGSGFNTIDYDVEGQQVQSAFANTYSQTVWGLAYVNDIILRDRNADGSMSTGSLGITGSGLEEREYAQHDAQFSVISITNRTGSVIQRIAYDPYGTATLLTASWAYDATLGGTNWWTTYFQGMTLVGDGAGNLLESDTRLYNVMLGRWVSQDGGYWDGLDLYAFGDDTPLSRRDPTGRDSTLPPSFDNLGKQLVCGNLPKEISAAMQLLLRLATTQDASDELHHLDNELQTTNQEIDVLQDEIRQLDQQIRNPLPPPVSMLRGGQTVGPDPNAWQQVALAIRKQQEEQMDELTSEVDDLLYDRGNIELERRIIADQYGPLLDESLIDVLKQLKDLTVGMCPCDAASSGGTT